jgi:hypothetical protein
MDWLQVGDFHLESVVRVVRLRLGSVSTETDGFKPSSYLAVSLEWASSIALIEQSASCCSTAREGDF